MENLRLVGTSHISRQSKKDIKKAYDELEPDVVAIELDKTRLHGLLTNQKPKVTLAVIRKVGVVGYLFLKIGSKVQQKLGSIVKVEPGSEMKYAYSLAAKDKKQVLLTDRPIQVTMARLSKYWTTKEKFRMVWDVITSPFKKEKMFIDLSKVPEDEFLAKLLELFKKQYPKLFSILVSERDVYMANMVKRYMEENPEKKILIVVGAGHVPGMKKILGLE